MFKMFCRNWPFRRRLRLFFALILAVVLSFFIYWKIVPTGRVTYDLKWPRGLASGRGFIYDFRPALRLATSSSDQLTVIADPVYFSLFTPRAFDQATVTINYINHLASDTPIIELGVLKDPVAGSYDLEPLQNEILDDYEGKWRVLSAADNKVVLESSPTYDSAAAFLKDLNAGTLKDCPTGPARCLALYNYLFTPPFSRPAGPVIAPLVVTQALRGSHQFYWYLPAGAWYLNFDLADQNQIIGADPVTVNLWQGSRLIAAKSLSDATAAPDGRVETRSLALNGTVKAAGVYKVEIKTTDDVIIDRLGASSDQLAFIGRIWPVGSSTPLAWFTDSPVLQAETSNAASLGPVKFGDQSFALNQTYQQFSWRKSGAGASADAAGAANMINLPHNDIILSNNGIFSLSALTLINPNPLRVDRYFTDRGAVKYILADYRAPQTVNGLITATATFNLREAVRENGKYTFVLSVPGLMIGSGTSLEIKEISVSLQGKTLWQKIRGK